MAGTREDSDDRTHAASVHRGVLAGAVTAGRLAVRAALALVVLAGTPAAAGQSRVPDGNRLPGALYPDVLALSESRQPAAALAALDARVGNLGTQAVPIEALVLRAQLLSAAGRPRESAALWRDIAGRDALLRAVALAALLDAQLAVGDLKEAEDTLTELDAAASGSRVDLVLRVAAACRAAGVHDRAVALYRRARQTAGSGPAADDAALGLAAALEAAGQPGEALEVVRGLRVTFRVPGTYPLAAAQAQRLATALSRPLEPATERDYASMAGRLAAGAEFQRAIDVLSEWRQAYPDTPSLSRIDAAIIENLYNQRANVEARARCALFFDRYPASPELPAVRITEFRLDVREGRTAAARTHGLAIWRGQVKAVPPEDRRSVGRLLAEYLVSIGEARDGLTMYDDLYQATPGRADRIDVLWRMAIAAMRARREERAVRDLGRVLALNPGAETLRAATYWLAAIEDSRGSRDAAIRRWTELVQRYPYSYYGVRAAERLRARAGSAATPGTGATPSLSFPDLALPEAVTSHRDYRAAALLARAGLVTEAASHAARLTQVFRGDLAVALLAARAAAAAGQHRAAFRLITSRFGPYLERPADRLPDDFWSLAYPRAYWPDIEAASRRHGVDPFLMLALMQQESQFDLQARSPAGALGIFQIMPSTADRVRLALGLDPVDPAGLMRPAVSAEIAAALLADLLKEFGGSLAPAVAAYNAGEERVRVWWQAASDVPEALFIDSIPYRETRGYVREVLANYFAYQRLTPN